jgi:predicted Zn-dependent peptidase
MSVDRSVAPKPTHIEKLNFLEPEVFTLDNGVKVYALKGGEQEIVKTDIILDTGSLQGNNRLVPSVTNDLLFTAAGNKNSEQIANEFDFFGAFNGKSSHYNDGTINNYTLTKHTEKVYNLLADTLYNASFTDAELGIYKFVKIQNLGVSKKKTSFLARRAFSQEVFQNHPYGFVANESDYEKLTTKYLTDFYAKYKKIKYIIISGNYKAETIKHLNAAFGTFGAGGTEFEPYEFLDNAKGKKVHIPKEDATQSTVRVGFRTINRLHPDYPKLGILVTLLGGFFGSRLMKNIREDKGYTYGISSSIISYPDCGLFVTQTDVKKEVYQDTLNEIYKEINRLKTEEISDDELDILSNYSLGSFLRSMDGAFSVSEKYKTLIDFKQGYNYYNNYIRLLRNINKGELIEIANKYFVEDNIYEVVAGV